MNKDHDNQELYLEPPLYFAENKAHIWHATFHPSADIMACSQINSHLLILSYNSDDVVTLIDNSTLHKSSVRYCDFNPTGNILASCGEDKRLGFLDGQGKQIHIIKKAHPSPLYRCKFLDDNTLISGDDDGLVKIWDLRIGSAVYEADSQSEAITGITFSQDQSGYNFIYTSCLDGTIAIYDLRQTSDSMSKLFCLSDSIDEELSSIELMKNGKYLVCPTSEGSVVIYKKEQPEVYVDRIQGLPGALDCMIKIDENTTITGCEDGYVRGVGFYPNKVLDVLGQHEEDDNFPIQSISMSHCKRFLASTSHDNSIKFYDINEFVKKRSKNVHTDMEEETESYLNEIDKASKIWDQKENEDSEEFEEDSSDSEEEEEPIVITKKRKQRNVNMKTHEKQMKKEKSKWFFKGL